MKRAVFEEWVIHECADYLAINKPPGLATLEDRAHGAHMLSIAKTFYKDIQVCHRLDKDTSGVLVFAKNNDAYRNLAVQFQERKVDKIYHAVVDGSTEFHNYLLDVPLIEKGHGTVKWDAKHGKDSKTYISTISNFQSFSLLECKPCSGRRHQIRVHLKYLNHSIIGDKKYDGREIYLSQIKKKYKSAGNTKRPIIKRMALHAFSISFRNMENEALYIEAAYPKDFEILLKQLNKYCAR
ncbi:MAG: pseudouridine synthase [Cytophagales bacterium]|nr:pseudouridine synthase [Cytophagales bacterium]